MLLELMEELDVPAERTLIPLSLRIDGIDRPNFELPVNCWLALVFGVELRRPRIR